MRHTPSTTLAAPIKCATTVWMGELRTLLWVPKLPQISPSHTLTRNICSACPSPVYTSVLRLPGLSRHSSLPTLPVLVGECRVLFVGVCVACHLTIAFHLPVRDRARSLNLSRYLDCARSLNLSTQTRLPLRVGPLTVRVPVASRDALPPLGWAIRLLLATS